MIEKLMPQLQCDIINFDQYCMFQKFLEMMDIYKRKFDNNSYWGGFVLLAICFLNMEYV